MNDEPNTRRWKAGAYVICSYEPKETRNLLQILGYDTFGQVVTVYVRQQHWKKPPKRTYLLRDLLDPRAFGIEVPA